MDSSPHSASDSLISTLIREVGNKIVEYIDADNTSSIKHHTSRILPLTPLSAAYLSRLFILSEHHINIQLHTYTSSHNTLSHDTKQYIISHTLHTYTSLTENSITIPRLYTICLVILYETLLYSSLHHQRVRQYQHHQSTIQQLNTICLASNNIHTLNNTQQVITLYRHIFAYMQKFQTELFDLDVDTDASKDTNTHTLQSKNKHIIDREIAAALESTFPQTGIPVFSQLSSDSKKQHIQLLCTVIVGIRLYNKYIEKGGIGIVDIYSSNDHSRHDSHKTINHFYSSYQQQIQFIQSTIQQYTTICCEIYESVSYESLHTGSIQHHSLPYLQYIYVYYTQYIRILQSILNECLQSINQCDEEIKQYHTTINELHHIIGTKTIVQKETVYPLFTTLYTSYHHLTVEYKKYMKHQKVIQQLQLYNSKLEFTLNEKDRVWADRRRQDMQTEEEEESHGADHRSAYNDFVVTYEHPTSNSIKFKPLSNDTNTDQKHNPMKPLRYTIDQIDPTDFMNLPLEYSGYDVVALVNRIPTHPSKSYDHSNHHSSVSSSSTNINMMTLRAGNPLKYGVIVINKKYYVFSTLPHMRLFCQDPEYYIESVKNQLCVQYPEYIYLLNISSSVIPYADIVEYCMVATSDSTLYQPMNGNHMNHPMNASSNNSTSAVSSIVVPVSNKVDASHQVETHINLMTGDYIKKHDPEKRDVWNEWVLRRDAIHLTDITNMKTHSTQTYASHFKRDNSSQYTLQEHIVHQKSDNENCKNNAYIQHEAPGVGTQTRVEKGQNTSRTTVYMSGLRDHQYGNANDVKVYRSTYVSDSVVEEGSNRPFNEK